MAQNIVSTLFSARYVRLSTRLAEKMVLSRSASKYRVQSFGHYSANCFVRATVMVLTYVRVRSASRRGLFLVLHPNIALSELAFGRASQGTMFLIRRRFNEQLERDVLRHDAHLFGVEPLTKRSQGEALLSAAATV